MPVTIAGIVKLKHSFCIYVRIHRCIYICPMCFKLYSHIIYIIIYNCSMCIYVHKYVKICAPGTF